MPLSSVRLFCRTISSVFCTNICKAICIGAFFCKRFNTDYCKWFCTSICTGYCTKSANISASVPFFCKSKIDRESGELGGSERIMHVTSVRWRIRDNPPHSCFSASDFVLNPYNPIPFSAFSLQTALYRCHFLHLHLHETLHG